MSEADTANTEDAVKNGASNGSNSRRFDNNQQINDKGLLRYSSEKINSGQGNNSPGYVSKEKTSSRSAVDDNSASNEGNVIDESDIFRYISEMKQQFSDFVAMAEEKFSNIHYMAEDIRELREQNEKLLSRVSEMENRLEVQAKTLKIIPRLEESIESNDKKIKKIEYKIYLIEDEIGFGESLNVAKVPPDILNIVYNTTLFEIVQEIGKRLGPYEQEKILTNVLEEIRNKTSGSELFAYFPGKGIVTRNVVKSLKLQLITAKQLHSTYTELIKSLLNYIPDYKSKNFRSVIKLKSQEYAVDKVTLLLRNVEEMTSNFSSMQALLKAASMNAETAVTDVHREAKGIHTELTQVKGKLLMTSNKIELISKKVEEILCSSDDSASAGSFEFDDDTREKIRTIIINELQIAKNEENMKQTIILRGGIISNIGEKGEMTVNQLSTELGEKDLEKIESVIKSLVDEEILIEKSYGRYKKYTLKEEDT